MKKSPCSILILFFTLFAIEKVCGATIDLSSSNRILYLDTEKQTIRVQAGITWQKIQDYVDAYDLSVLATEEYFNFSVGGSFATHTQAREKYFGPLTQTVESLCIMLGDGSLVEANMHNNCDLFCKAITGIHCGIIVEATVRLASNAALKRIGKLFYHCF